MREEEELYEVYLDNAENCADTGNSKSAVMWIKMARQIKSVSKRFEDELIERASRNAIFAKTNRLIL